MRYVIYDPATGAIRAVVLGYRNLAEDNLREGEAIVEHIGFVSVRRHRVQDGAVVEV